MQKDIFKVLYNKAPKNYLTNILNTENNISSLESKYLNGKPEILVIDNFLSSRCFERYFSIFAEMPIFLSTHIRAVMLQHFCQKDFQINLYLS